MSLIINIGEFRFFNQNRFTQFPPNISYVPITSHTYAKFQYIPSRSLRDYEILMQYMSRVFPLCIHLYFKIGTYYTNCGIARFNLLTSKLILSVFVSNERPLTLKDMGVGVESTHWSGDCLPFLTGSCYGHNNS